MNIVLVRADGIGDALACAPLIAALQDAGHAVSAVLGPRNRDIFARAALARVHVLERIPWPRHGSTPRSRRIALREVRAARYDAALIASEELDAYRFAVDAKIPQRIGFTNGWEKPLKTVQLRTMLTRTLARTASAARVREHEAQTVFRLGNGLHRAASPTRDTSRLARLLLDERANAHGRIVVQVSSKLANGGLDAAAYVAAVRALVARGYEVLVLGDEERLRADVARASGAPGEPRLTLHAWKARIAGARALVTPDSGAAHVAGMLGVPCIDCFPAGATSAYDIVRWHPWASPYRAVVLDVTRPSHATGTEISSAVDGLLTRIDGSTRANPSAPRASQEHV